MDLARLLGSGAISQAPAPPPPPPPPARGRAPSPPSTRPKRKRKSRLSAKQRQARAETQQDESRLLHLTLDINDLKQQVRECLTRIAVHETRALVHRQHQRGAVLRTTEQLFNIFRVGHRSWAPHETAFFSSTLDDRLVLNAVITGVDVFFDQWRRYKLLLSQRCFRIDCTRVLVCEAGACIVECKGEFEGDLTFTAVRTLFPYLLANPDLLARVVNRHFVCPTRTLLYFDASGRIVQYDAHADMFTALSRILAADSAVDIVAIMASARISAEGSMIPDPDNITAHTGGDDYYNADAGGRAIVELVADDDELADSSRDANRAPG